MGAQGTPQDRSRREPAQKQIGASPPPMLGPPPLAAFQLSGTPAKWASQVWRNPCGLVLLSGRRCQMQSYALDLEGDVPVGL